MEDDINGRQPQWKMTTLACLTSQFCSELGPAQPQLVSFIITRIPSHSRFSRKAQLKFQLQSSSLGTELGSAISDDVCVLVIMTHCYFHLLTDL